MPTHEKVDPAFKKFHFDRIGYTPHPKQREFHDHEARFKIAVCGRRYGKTTMAARELEVDLLDPSRPGMVYWIVAPTYTLGSREFNVIWKDLVLETKLANHKGVRKSNDLRSGKMFIKMPNESLLEVKSAERPESLLGEGLAGVIMAEAAQHKRETWTRFIRPSLADHHGPAYITTTPLGRNWIYDMYLLGKKESEEEYASWHCPSWENSVLYPKGRWDKEILEIERNSPEQEFEQEIAASFTAFKGQVYNEFDLNVHVQDIPYNPSYKNYLFWDFGYINACAVLDVMITPQDEVLIWREEYLKNRTMDEIIAYIKGRDNPSGYHADLSTGDSADPAAIYQICRDLMPCVGEPESKENWREGISLVKRFLQTRPDGKPGLLVDPVCTKTIWEFINYRMKESTVVDKDPKEEANKVNDHAMDALRYGLMHLYNLSMMTSLVDFQDVNNTRSQVPLASELDTVPQNDVYGVASGIFNLKEMVF